MACLLDALLVLHEIRAQGAVVEWVPAWLVHPCRGLSIAPDGDLAPDTLVSAHDYLPELAELVRLGFTGDLLWLPPDVERFLGYLDHIEREAFFQNVRNLTRAGTVGLWDAARAVMSWWRTDVKVWPWWRIETN